MHALLIPLLAVSLTAPERLQLYTEHAHANASEPDALIDRLEAELAQPDTLSAPLVVLWTDAIARYGSDATKARARAAWSAARAITVEPTGTYPLLIAGTAFVPQVSGETLSEYAERARQDATSGISAWACDMPARDGRDDRLRQELCEGPSNPDATASTSGLAPDPALDIDKCLNVALVDGLASENLEAAAEACAGTMDLGLPTGDVGGADNLHQTPDGLKIAPFLIPIIAAGIGAAAVVGTAVITQMWEDKRQAAQQAHEIKMAAQAEELARAREEREAAREAAAAAPPPAPSCENTCTEGSDDPIEGGSGAGARALSDECAAFGDAFTLEAARDVDSLDFRNPHMDPRKALLNPESVAAGEDVEVCGMDATTLRTESDACGSVDCNGSGIAAREAQACCGTHAAVQDHARASCAATAHCSPEDPGCCEKAGRVQVPSVREPNGPSPVPEMPNDRPDRENRHPGRPDRP